MAERGRGGGDAPIILPFLPCLILPEDFKVWRLVDLP